jgi:hypothetical protein
MYWATGVREISDSHSSEYVHESLLPCSLRATILMMEAVSTSLTSSYFNETTRRYIPEDCQLHLGFESQIGQNFYRPFATRPIFRSALGPTSIVSKRDLKLKCPERAADQSIASSIRVQNALSYISTWCLGARETPRGPQRTPPFLHRVLMDVSGTPQKPCHWIHSRANIQPV